MTLLALVPQTGAVGVILTPDPVTVVAARGRPLDKPVEVAGGAGDGEVTALEREKAGLVERAGGEVPSRRGMARVAALRHAALVRVGMAKIAVFLVGHVGARLVAGGTVPGDGGVLFLEGEPSLLAMIEGLGVEGPDVGVAALVLDVANLAVARDLAVDPPFRGDAGGDRRVAGEAALGDDSIVLTVALLAVGGAPEGRVRPRERTGSGLLIVGPGGRRCKKNEGQKNQGASERDAGTNAKDRFRIWSIHLPPSEAGTFIIIPSIPIEPMDFLNIRWTPKKLSSPFLKKEGPPSSAHS